MAIAQGTHGTVATWTTPVSVPYPASGIVKHNLLLMFVTNKYPTNGPSTPTNWTALAFNQYSRGGGTPGADTGDVYITLYIKIATGSESGNVSVTITGANTSIGRIMQYTKDALKSWGIALAGGSDNSAGTAWSVTAGSDPGVTANDMVLVGSGICGNTDTMTAEFITQTGVTFGAMVERQDSGSNTGDDISLVISEHPVSSGTGSAAPVFTATVAGTGSANAAGASIFVRLREVDPHAIAGVIAASASVSGALTVTSTPKAIAGVVNGVAAVSGVLTVVHPLAGTIASLSTFAGALTVAHPIAGTIAASASVSGALTANHPLAGIVARITTE